MNPHPGPLILDHSSWTAHPGAHIFPVPGPALFGHTRYRSSIPAALRLILDSVRRCGGSWTADPGPLIQVDPSSDGPSIPGHPGPGQGHLIPLILSGGSWTIPGHRGRRDILDYPDGSRWIPMDPHPMGRGFSCIRWAGHPMGRWIYLYIQHPPSLIGSARG